MESLIVQFSMGSHPALDERTRVVLREAADFKPLPPKRAEQAWGSPVPGQICFIAQIQESAVFISEDWMTTIRSRRLIDCVGGMCAVINALTKELGGPVTVELWDIRDSRGNSLYRQLDRERNTRRCLAIGLWFFALAASAFAGALIQWIFGGGL